MNRIVTIKRHWLVTLLAAVLMAAASGAAWGQTDTDRGVRVTKAVGEETDTKVTKVTVTTATSNVDTDNPVAGQIITAKEGRNVTVVTAGPRQKEGKMQVAKVTVTKITDIKATGITVTSAGNVGEMNGNATLQMTANFDPTYTDDKTVVWSVEPAPESSATATIDENGLLTAGTTQGNVVVTATATNGTATTDDDKTDSKTITITTIPLTATSTTINVAAATYTGSALTPGVTVKYGTTDLVEGQDYTRGSWTNNTNAGTASVTITGMGAYSGSIVKNFTIDRANWTGNISLSYTKLSNGYKKVHVQYNGSGNISGWKRCSSTNANWNGPNSDSDWEVSDNSETNTSFDDTFTGALQKVQYRVTIAAGDSNHNQTDITSEMFSTP